MKRKPTPHEGEKPKRFLHEVFDNPDVFKTHNKLPIPEQRGTRTLFIQPTSFAKCDVSIKRNPR